MKTLVLLMFLSSVAWGQDYRQYMNPVGSPSESIELLLDHWEAYKDSLWTITDTSDTDWILSPYWRVADTVSIYYEPIWIPGYVYHRIPDPLLNEWMEFLKRTHGK